MIDFQEKAQLQKREKQDALIVWMGCDLFTDPTGSRHEFT